MVVIEIKKADSVFVEKIKEMIKKKIGQKTVPSKPKWDEDWNFYGVDKPYKNCHIGRISWDAFYHRHFAFDDAPRRTLEIISFYPFFTELIKKLEFEFEEFDFKIIIEERF